ncbi:MAG TPA: GNAT family protein [Thermomicrobiales bacterium]|nr:GNAT family protein [Thermomicrobiales bacterium]
MVDAMEQSGPLASIVGERVALGPLRRDLLPTYQRWINDFRVMRTRARPPRPATLEAQQAEYDYLAASDTRHFFTIYERATWRPIGGTGLQEIDERARSAWFAISIAEPDCRGRGYGTEATRLMLAYAFTTLGLHSVALTVYEFNLAGRRAYQKAGFRECGRRRQCRWLGGRLWDEISMECLASEFTGPPLARAALPDPP